MADHGALLVFDAQRGFGQRMAAEAVRAAIRRARDTGAAVLGLRNSAHIGRIGTYAELAAAENMAFVAFVNVADHEPIQAPYACREARLGTNPFCAAIPGRDEDTLLLDMATTAIAFGKARVAYNKRLPVPPGTLIDADGNPTTDPARMVEEHAGALLSFGLHKGSGLAVMCEMLGAVLTGGLRANGEQAGGIVNSMVAVVIDLARFGDPAGIRSGVAASAAYIKSSLPAPGFDEVLLPGDPERREAARRAVEGIPLDDRSWAEMREAAREVGVSDEEIARAVSD